MDFTKLSVLYSAQISIGKLLSELCEKQYPNKDFITLLQKEADNIGEQLGGGYFADCYWLTHPLSLPAAHQLYQRMHP